jgi:hypothetical protein
MTIAKPARNDPCPCGSGKLYKHCCKPSRRELGRRRRAPAASSAPTARKADVDPQLSQLTRLAREVSRDASPEQAQQLQRLLEMAEEAVAYEAMHDEIEAAALVLEDHRAEFEELMDDLDAAMALAHCLFAEEPFRPTRFSATDVHRAFEAMGYPSRSVADPDAEMETIIRATLFLADEDEGLRMHFARQLLAKIPEYVRAERYKDAWMLQYSAVQIVEAPDRSNYFLFEMFNYGYDEWAKQMDSERESMLRELGLDLPDASGMDVVELEALAQGFLADPAKQAEVEAYMAAHPMMRERAEADNVELERSTLLLLERTDAGFLYLTQEEISPWLPILEERLAPLGAQARQAIEQEDWGNVDLQQAGTDALFELSREMVPSIFTPERLGQLKADLMEYWRTLSEAGEARPALYAHAAYRMLARDDPPAEIPLLHGICFDSVRKVLASAGEEYRRGAYPGDGVG